MKKVFAIISMLAIIAAVGAVSCKKEAKDSIKLDKKAVSVTHRGDVVNITVTASGEFTAQRDAEWLSVSGSTITVDPNPFEASRTATVTFYCGAENAAVVITQEGRGPKELVSFELEALMANDYDSFWDNVDLTDARKQEIQAAYNEKMASQEQPAESNLASYQFVSQNINDATSEAEVVTKLIYKEGDPAEQTWLLIKRDGKWKVKGETFGK